MRVRVADAWLPVVVTPDVGWGVLVSIDDTTAAISWGTRSIPETAARAPFDGGDALFSCAEVRSVQNW